VQTEESGDAFERDLNTKAAKNAKQLGPHLRALCDLLFKCSSVGQIFISDVFEEYGRISNESNEVHSHGEARMASQTVFDDAKIRLSGIDALNRALGHVRALRFMTLIQGEPTDYVQISRRLYKNQTVAQIFERAKSTWKQNRR
jgi:hypothetical protein